MGKRILFVYQYAFSMTGGVQTFNRYFVSALEQIVSESNIDAELLSIYDNEKDTVSSLPYKTLNKSKIRAIKEIATVASQYDVIILSLVNLAPLGIVAKLFNPKVKIIFCTHGIEVWRKQSKFTEFIMNRSKILTVSSFSKKMIMNYNKTLKSENITIIHNSIKGADSILEINTSNNANFFNVLTVTRLDATERLKGVDSVIYCLPELIKKIPNIKYTVIGKGDDLVRLKSLSDKLGMSKYIEFLGYVEDLESYYFNCDIFILPSKKEGFGIVYLEAMKHRKPVIAADYGGSTDVVVHGETGFLCEYNNIKEIGDRILQLYSNRDLKREMGEKGYARLLQYFTFETFVNNLKNYLSS